MKTLFKLLLLVLILGGGFYFYSLDSEESAAFIEQVESSIAEPAPVLDIKVTANTTRGMAPLNLAFKVQSSSPELVESTYSRVAGDENLFDGLPKVIFAEILDAGEHTGVFAVRYKNGKVVEKTINIFVEEETAEDFKRRLWD